MTAASSTIRRRSFLKSAASAAAFPTIIASTALGKDGRAPASERISVGVIGTGKMCHGYHLNSLLGYDDVQIVAICEVDTNRRNSAMQKIQAKYSGKTNYQGCDEYTDFREVIARDDIDAVLIATPDHWHAIPLIEACKAGKDVYCEKPLTLTILEAQRCIEAARKYDRVVQTGSQQRSSVFGPFRKACELIRSGRIGKIQSVTVGVGGPSKWCDLPAEELEPGLEWNMWLGQAPERPYHSDLSRAAVSRSHGRSGEPIASTPAADTPTWEPIITTLPNGLWEWTNRDRSKSSRPKILPRERGSNTFMPMASR